jgi:hypothetical protein
MRSGQIMTDHREVCGPEATAVIARAFSTVDVPRITRVPSSPFDKVSVYRCSESTGHGVPRIRGHARVSHMAPSRPLGEEKGATRPARADPGGRSDAIALASRHVRVPNRTHVLRFHDHGGTGRGGRPRCQGCPASRSQLPSPWGGRGHSRRRDRFVLDFSRCPTASPPQHSGTPGLSREPLSGQ